MCRRERTEKLLFIAVVFSCTLIFAVWRKYDALQPTVRFCCRDNGTCINSDVIKASEFNSSSSSDIEYRIVKGKPCSQLYTEDELNFTIREV